MVMEPSFSRERISFICSNIFQIILKILWVNSGNYSWNPSKVEKWKKKYFVIHKIVWILFNLKQQSSRGLSYKKILFFIDISKTTIIFIDLIETYWKVLIEFFIDNFQKTFIFDNEHIICKCNFSFFTKIGLLV